MNIWKRANSPYYSYRFAYKGKIYSRSTGTTNKVDAMNVASAARLKLIRQEAGLEAPEPVAAAEPAPTIPTLRQYQEIFDAWVGTAKEEQKGTVKFYRENYANSSNTAHGPICRSTGSTSRRSRPSRPGH